MKVLSWLSWDSLAWHSLHKGMYMFSPPIIVWQSLEAVLKVKLAFCLHSLQMAVNFFIFSHLGINWRMHGKAPLKKVPCKEEMITTLPLLEAFSENSTISVKNWPSSMPITSKSLHSSFRSASTLIGFAVYFCPEWVEMEKSAPYLLSAENLTLRTFLPVILCLLHRLKSSVVLPANMHPIISSMRPRWRSIGAKNYLGVCIACLVSTG